MLTSDQLIGGANMHQEFSAAFEEWIYGRFRFHQNPQENPFAGNSHSRVHP